MLKPKQTIDPQNVTAAENIVAEIKNGKRYAIGEHVYSYNADRGCYIDTIDGRRDQCNEDYAIRKFYGALEMKKLAKNFPDMAAKMTITEVK